jgi:cell wall hydrolase
MAGLTPDALDLVVRTLLAEADQTPEGYQAVAHVIKNRVDSGAWGSNTRLGPVINARKQFSVWNPDNPKMQALAARVRAIPTTDPNYQRAANVASQVFAGQLPDNTNGATHYYAPKAMPNGQSPEWAAGQNGQMIGSQIFYRLPLTAANTAGTAIVGPSTVTSDADSQAARQFLASLSAHPTRPGDTANMNPAFAIRLANAIKQARAEGLPVTVTSGFREEGQTGSKYDAGGNSSHSYGLASDIGGLDGPNGRITQRWAQIAEQNGLHNPYGVSNSAEFNHWQLPELPLEQSPTMLAALKAAKASGDWSKVWSAYSAPDTADARKTFGPSLPPAVEEPNPNAPAPAAQPAAATAPAGVSPIPGSRQSPSAGFVGPGSDKVSLVQSMTTGTSHNPQITTAANWGNLFGGAEPAAPPAAAPAAAATPAAQPASAPTPPLSAPLKEQPGSPLSSIVPNWGTEATYNPEEHPSLTPDAHMPFGSGGKYPAMTPGQPSMGFPAMTNPFGEQPAQTSMLPGSMLASAQDLIRRLFPSSVG